MSTCRYQYLRFALMIACCCGGVIAGHLGYPITRTAMSYGVA
jgi:hypothetical protein